MNEAQADVLHVRPGTRAACRRERSTGYSERGSEGIVRGNVFGRPLQAAVHVANWRLDDQFIAVRLDRLRVLRALRCPPGSVVMPLEDMFWGAYFGQWTDRFGVNWMVNRAPAGRRRADRADAVM